MANHQEGSGPRRQDRPSYGNQGSGDRRSSGGDRREGGFRGNRDDRPQRSNDDRPRREGGYNSERPQRDGGFRGGDRREGGFNGGDRREGAPRGNRDDRPQRDGGFRGGDRREGGFGGDRRNDDRPQRREGGYNSDRPQRDGGFRGGDRPQRSNDDRPRRDDRGDRGSRPARPQRDGGRGRDQREERAPRDERDLQERIGGDIRAANRDGREKSPDIDADVTGDELERFVLKEIGYLDDRNAGWVAKHLVMAARYIDVDPELAFEHAEAASRRGGRVGFVREAVGLTAYAAGKYHEALRELRTYRRISGSDDHLALIADSERALGRADKALETLTSPEALALTGAAGVEIAIVTAGLHIDAERFDEAVKALEIPALDINKAFSYSPRLFEAYADALEAAGRTEEAAPWRARIAVAEQALGLDVDEEPEILDLDDLLDDMEEDEDGDVLPSAEDAVAGYREEQGLELEEDAVHEIVAGGEDEDGDLLPEGFEDPMADESEDSQR